MFRVHAVAVFMLHALILASLYNICTATTTLQSTSASTDIVAMYYQLYLQQQEQTALAGSVPTTTSLPPLVFKQNVPSEVQARLDRYNLQFRDLPELLKRALLWDSGYSIGDSASLTQIYTRCGLSMDEIALSESEFAATMCKVSSCDASLTAVPSARSDRRFATTCRPDQLLLAAKCATTAVDTVSNSPLWTSEPSSASTALPPTIAVPHPVIRRHKYVTIDKQPSTHVYAIHVASSNTLDTSAPATVDSVCRIDDISTRATAAVVPCVPYQRIDPRWCRPAPSTTMATWLDTFNATQYAHTTLHDLDIANRTLAPVERGSAQTEKDTHGVAASTAFVFDGTSSDLTQQFYKRHLARDDDDARSSSNAVTKLFVQTPLPREIAQRLSDAALAFDDLPPLLQRALVWDSGYVVVDATDSSGAASQLVPVLVQCGLSMSDVAVPRASVEALGNASCLLQRCSSANGSDSQRATSVFECMDNQLASKSLCAVATDALSDSDSLTNHNNSAAVAVKQTLWADGGDDTAVPNAKLRRHVWRSATNGAVSEMFSIDTSASTTTSPENATAASTTASPQCPTQPSMVIPCASIAAAATTASTSSTQWCMPRTGALVTSWLRQVAKDKEFSLLYLVPILVAVALAVTGLAIYIRRKTIRRTTDAKVDRHDARAHTITSSLPDNAYFPVRSLSLESVQRTSDERIVVNVAPVDTALRRSALSPPVSPTSSTSSIESFAAYSSNRVLDALVNHPTLRRHRIAYDDVQCVVLHSRPGSAGPELWRGAVRGCGGADSVAIKRLPCNTRKATDDELEAFVAEITVCATIGRHPNIVTFVGVAWTTLQNVCLITEFVADGCDLRTYLLQHCVELAWTSTKRSIALGIANALEYVHQTPLSPKNQQPHYNIVHGDLQAKHVLLTRDLEAKLINVGARTTTMCNRVGAANTSSASRTTFWTAPEVLRGEPHTDKTDMFAFGLVLAELDTHELPFDAALAAVGTSSDLTSMPPHSIGPSVTAGALPPLPATSPFCPLEVANLIAACLQADPQQRPSARDAATVLTNVPIAAVEVKTYSF